MILSINTATIIDRTGMLYCQGADGFDSLGFRGQGVAGLVFAESMSCRLYIGTYMSRQSPKYLVLEPCAPCAASSSSVERIFILHAVS